MLGFDGLGRVEVDQIAAGDLCALVGLEPIEIGDTVADVECNEPLPAVTIDQPTLHMTFRVSDGPFSGQDGKYVTSRQISERLQKELGLSTEEVRRIIAIQTQHLRQQNFCPHCGENLREA